MAPAPVKDTALGVQRAVRDDVALASRESGTGRSSLRVGALSLRHHAMRALGAILGSRAERLPPRLSQALSLEGRAR